MRASSWLITEINVHTSCEQNEEVFNVTLGGNWRSSLALKSYFSLVRLVTRTQLNGDKLKKVKQFSQLVNNSDKLLSFSS